MTEETNVYHALPVGVAAAQVPLPALPRAFGDEGFEYYLPDQMESYARAAVAMRAPEPLRAEARRMAGILNVSNRRSMHHQVCRDDLRAASALLLLLIGDDAAAAATVSEPHEQGLK